MPEQKRKCPHCGYEFSDQHANECPSCGESV